MSTDLDAPLWCLVCEVDSEGFTYLAFINEHAHCADGEVSS